MVSMNNVMSEKISHIDWQAKKLPPELSEIAKSGFSESKEGVFITALRNRNTNIRKSDFPDRTGYECFVSSIHIGDFVKSDYLAYACLFVGEVLDLWRSSDSAGVIQAIISSDEFGAVVKFHFLRVDEEFLNSNLEDYEEAVLVADSSTIKFLEIPGKVYL